KPDSVSVPVPGVTAALAVTVGAKPVRASEAVPGVTAAVALTVGAKPVKASDPVPGVADPAADETENSLRRGGRATGGCSVHSVAGAPNGWRPARAGPRSSSEPRSGKYAS